MWEQLISKIVSGCRQACCVRRLIDHQRQSLRLLGKMGDDPFAIWKSKIKWYSEKQSLQGYESNRWHANGVRVENIPRIHYGHPREDSKSNGISTVWTWVLQRQDHLHVNVQRHWMESKRKQRKMWLQFTDSCALCSQIPSRSLVFLAAWIRKREMVRNLHWQNPTDHGINLQRIWWQISQDPVIR